MNIFNYIPEDFRKSGVILSFTGNSPFCFPVSKLRWILELLLKCRPFWADCAQVKDPIPHSDWGEKMSATIIKQDIIIQKRGPDI